METSDPKYKHKPSEKHTLEEVLKSLQDLIRNDLAEGASGAAMPKTGNTGLPGSGAETTVNAELPREASNLREDFTPASPAEGPVNLDAVMRSLKDLVGNELNVGDKPKSESPPPASKHDEYLSMVDDIEEYLPQEFSPLNEEPAPAEETESLVPTEPGIPEVGEEAPPAFPDEAGAPAATTDQTDEEDVAPGTQREIFFDEAPPPAAEPGEITLEVPDEPAESASPEVPAPVTEEPADGTDTSLPTIEVEENFDSADYRETMNGAPAEIPPPEETTVLDVGITDEIAAPEMEQPSPAPAEEEASIVLEIVDEPDSGIKVVADFDALDAAEAAPENRAPAVAVEPETETPRETGAETKSDAEQPAVEAPAAAAPAFHPDDIPVLNEVVAPPAGGFLPPDSHAVPLESLPSPDRARDIVVRAVAKLNIEMRKSGGAGLDTRTILRLQQLIRQELEKVGGK